MLYMVRNIFRIAEDVQMEDWEVTLKHARVGRLSDKVLRLRGQYSKLLILAAKLGHRTEFRWGESAAQDYVMTRSTGQVNRQRRTKLRRGAQVR